MPKHIFRSKRLKLSKIFHSNTITTVATAIVFLALTFLPALIPKAQAVDWYTDTGTWSYRKKITIQSSEVEADLDNFPVLINTKHDDFKNVAKEDGGDIRFTKGDGITEIPREIEFFDKSGGELVAWVKVDVKDLQNVDIYIYYGNSEASEPAADSTYGSEKVWDSSFKMVQHLQESPDNGVAGHIDSTSNSSDGTPYNFDNDKATSTTDPETDDPNWDTNKKIDGADVFDGTLDYVSASDPNFNETTSFSVEIWYAPNEVKEWNGLFSFKDAGNYGIQGTHTSAPMFIQYGYTLLLSGISNPSVGEWTHLVVTYDSSTGNYSLYQNSVLADSAVNNSVCSTTTTLIGTSLGARYFNGTIDEVRISNTARDENWISTSFNNQNNPGGPDGFYSLGGAEAAGEEEAVPEFTTLTAIIAFVLGFGIYLLIKRKNSRKG